MKKIQTNLITFIKKYRLQLLIAVVFLFCYFIFVLAERHFFTYDTVVSQVRWWNYLSEHGWSGIATLNTAISADYTTIWYFIIALFTKPNIYPHFPIEYSIKFMAIVCTLLSAIAVFFISKHFQPKARYLPVIAAGVTLFLPLFSMDLLKTNLTDGMYIMPSLWSFYFFLKNKKGLAWFLLAIGACFKLMAVYLAPVYLFFYIKDFKSYNLREKLAPLWGLFAVFICSIPNILAGGKLLDGIVTPIIGRGDDGAPIPFLWLVPMSNDFTPDNIAQDMKGILYALLILVFFMTFFFILKYVKKERQTQVGLAILPALSIMICYYLLPAQHETYFAMAGVFAMIGFLAIPGKNLFVNFIAINIFLFYMYLFGITWWYENPTWVLPIEQMSVIFLGVIIFNYYLIYKNSIFYNLPGASR